MLPFYTNCSINSLPDQRIAPAGNHCMNGRSNLASVEVVEGNQGSKA